jgi:hypothetical protein
VNAKLRRAGVAVAVAVLAAGGLQVVTSAPAAAVTGLVRVVSAPTSDDDQADKSTSVACPAESPRIVGGGIVINDPQRLAFARFMQPTKNLGGGPDSYAVAATVPPGFVGTYSLEAIAVCASDDGVSGHEVVAGTPTTASSTPGQETLVGCSSSTKRVIGFGGGVIDGGQEVGLQTVRADGLRGIARIFAHEDASGYRGQWRLQAYAFVHTDWEVAPGTGIGLIHQMLPSRNLKQSTVIITPGSTAAFTSTICLP